MGRKGRKGRKVGVNEIEIELDASSDKQSTAVLD